MKVGDEVTVYGLLVKQNDKFIIANTNKKQLPFMILLGDKTKFKDFYYLELIESFVIILIIGLLYFLNLSNFFKNYVPIMVLLMILMLNPITGLIKIIKSVQTEEKWII